MRGQQYSQIFVFSHSYPSSDIFSSTLLQGLSKTLPWENDKSTGHLGQKFWGGNCPRTQLNPSQTFFTSFRSATFISSFTGRPRILSYPRTGYWAQPFLMRSVYMRLDIGLNPFPIQFEHMRSIGPHNSPLKSFFFGSSGEKEDFDSLVWSALWSGFIGSNCNNTCLSSCNSSLTLQCPRRAFI